MASIELTVPEELATALAGIPGVERSASSRRSGTWQIVAEILAGTSVTISLLQAPQTLTDVAQRLHGLLRGRVKDGRAIHIDAVGPGGEMRLTIDGHTDLDDVTELLRSTVFDSGQ